MSKDCYYENDDFKLLHGDALLLLKKLKPQSVDMIFADPPYFLSGDGITCSAGKMVSVKKGDFIYFDPPYDSDTTTFNSYTEDGFGKEEQKRLARVYKELSDRGCYVMLSNHNTSLIKELYKDFNIHVIEAKRNINANGKKRGKVEEVIITNYENKRGFEE